MSSYGIITQAILNPRLKLTVRELPFEVPSVSFAMLWHPRSNQDSGLKWLRQIIKSSAKSASQDSTVKILS